MPLSLRFVVPLALALAAIAYGVVLVSPDFRVTLVASQIAFVNVALGLFNLVPGFPLDGGRVLRAVLWTATGNVRRATEGAAAVGKLVAYGLVGLGIYLILQDITVTGLWIGAIGWFLHNAAIMSFREAKCRKFRLKKCFARFARRDSKQAQHYEALQPQTFAQGLGGASTCA